MTKRPDTSRKGADETRDARLKAALKANIARRKAQMRARKTSQKPEDGREQ